MKFQTPDEAALWAEVYVAYLRAPLPISIDGQPTTGDLLADRAVELYRERCELLRAQESTK